MSQESSPSRPFARRPGRRHAPGRSSRRLRPALMLLEGRALLATITVTSLGDSGPGTLRQAIVASSPGGTINFASSLDGGTISLTSGPLSITEDLTIQGPGAGHLIVDGGGKQGIFAIQPATLAATSPPPVVAIDGLTIADGLITGASGGGGGGIAAYQTDLTLDYDSFLRDQATGNFGGAVSVRAGNYSSSDIVAGSLSITGSNFQGDQAEYGGALWLDGVPTTILGSWFSGDTASSGGAIDQYGGSRLSIVGGVFTGDQASDPASFALGGAISVTGTATVTSSSFSGNQAVGEFAQGGAIFAGSSGSILTVTGSSFVDNQAIAAGAGGQAGGGALAGDPGTSMTVSGSEFVYNSAQGGGISEGGAIENVGASAGSSGVVNPVGLTISGSTFSYNLALGLNSSGGSGSSGGVATGGAVFSGDGANTSGGGFLVLTGSQFEGNQAVGGSGGAAGHGGYADGGAVNSQPPLTLAGSTFGSNMARGGSGGLGGGFGAGGGISEEEFDDSTASTISSSLFASNDAIGGAGTGPSAAGGYAQGGGLNLLGDRGSMDLTGVAVAYNWAVGGAGGPAGSSASAKGGAGGAAYGGGLSVSSASFTVEGGSFVYNLAKGGAAPAGAAGVASGGAIYQDSSITLALSDAPIFFNMAEGGDGLSGGNGEGAGLWIAGIVSMADELVSGNNAQGGSAGQGLGGGTFVASGGTLTVDAMTSIAFNRASTSGNDRYSA